MRKATYLFESKLLQSFAVRFWVLTLLLLVCVGGVSGASFTTDSGSEWNQGSFSQTEESGGTLQIVDPTHNVVSDEGDGTADGTTATATYALGDSFNNEEYGAAFKFCPDNSYTIDKITVDISDAFGSDYGFTVDMWIDSSFDDSIGDGTKVKSGYDPSFSTGEQTITLDSSYSVTGGNCYELDILTNSQNGNGDTDALKIRTDTSASDTRAKEFEDSFGASDQNRYGDLIFEGSFSSGSYTSKTYTANEKQVWDNITIGNFNKNSGSIDVWVKTSNDGFSTTLEEEKVSSSQFSSSGTDTVDLSLSQGATDVKYNISISKGGSSPTIDSVELKGFTANKLPVVDNKSVSPDPVEIGKDVDYSAEVSDPDGSIDYTNLQVFDDGSKVFDENRGSTTPEWSNISSAPTEGDWDARIEVFDDRGDSRVEWINRSLTDDPPTVSLSKPLNQTYWKYGVPVEFSVSDSDDHPGEDWNCDIDRDGSLYEEVFLKEGTNSSFSGTVRSDLGSHTVNVSCVDGSGNTDSVSENYEVDNFRYLSNSTSSPVFETENLTYNTKVKVGAMVNSLDSFLYWNSSLESSRDPENSGVNNYTFDHYFRPPLVESNASSFDWKFKTSYNYSTFAGSTTVDSMNSTPGSQTVYHGFYWKNQSTDKENYIIRDTVNYEANIVNRTAVASVEGSLQTNQTSEINDLSLNNVYSIYSKYEGSAETKDINSKEISLGIYSNYTVTFQGDSREFNSSVKKLSLNDIVLQKCSQGGETALVFNTFREEDLTSPVVSDLVAAFSVWNPDDPSFKKTFNFSSENKTSHEFCIEPSYAEYKIDNTDKLLQYEESSSYNGVGDYALRSYFLINETINNQTTNVPLYMLWSNQSSRIRFEVVDTNDEPVEGAIVKNERYFPAKDKYIPVAMVRTGSQGQSESFLEVNEIYYQFKIFNQEGELVEEKAPQIIPSDLDVRLVIGDELLPSYYDRTGKVASSCSNNVTRLECSYSSETENVENVTLQVDEKLPVTFNTTCVTSSSSSSGTLICDGLNTTSGKYKYSLKAKFSSDSDFLLVDTGWIGSLSSDYGETGLFMTFMIGLTLGFAGLWKPEAGITLFGFGMIVSYAAGFLVISQTALISFITLGILLIWRMS